MTARRPLPPFGHGLDLTAVLDVATLPDELRASLLAYGPEHRQLIVVCHAGRAFWEALRASGIASDDPVDDFTTRVVDAFLREHARGVRHRMLHPGDRAPSLQGIGALAGIHHDSRFMVGIHPTYGTWFAYRALVLADTDFAPTVVHATRSPCLDCAARPCVARCPAGAIGEHAFDLARCVAYRRTADSACRNTCLARTSCPVGSEHRYDDEQLRYHYGRSMRTIESMPWPER